MKLSKNQLKKIIKEYLEIQSQPLNEGVKGTYLVNELVKSFDVSDDAKTKLVNAINLVNDTAVLGTSFYLFKTTHSSKTKHPKKYCC